ncbi:N-acetylgalactosaminyltransferase 7 isoform X1 [Xyrichtys novacula]|uniref:Polypeptide N-acetylgalactosaminyltransferase n=1 Tax=Xyrichtys novacula TaxID=13765 RepID=A0AAV1EW97_XYRNO|nr:N-acetylgalactosaminyltransferase 7 isoform X1 [Xyrichtys novacula]
MRGRVGLRRRTLLLVGTFLGLLVLWSLLTPKPSHKNPFGEWEDAALPRADPVDHFKPVVPWPHVEGVEVDLHAIRLKRHPENPPKPDQQPNQKQVIQQQYMTFKPHTHAYTDPVLKKGILGNFEPKQPELPGVAGGPGEEAKPFVLGPEYKDAVQASIKEFGFNMVASDMISLDRSINDIRHEECKYWEYDDRLLTSSVVIVFHNEGWSTLERLEDYIKQWNGLVKLFRNEKREGLIQARSIGAKKATKGQVLIYLDAHCEVGTNWTVCTVPLIPLLFVSPSPPFCPPTPCLCAFTGTAVCGCLCLSCIYTTPTPSIPMYSVCMAPPYFVRTVCTVPLIDIIDGHTYTITTQGAGDKDNFARGAWDWNMRWSRIPLGEREKRQRQTRTEPYRSPAMAGGLFAIERDFFFELGLYDPGLQIWGGENFEISYKIWQCGGQLLFVPCSRVGHVYRLEGWQGNPPPAHVGSSPTLKNYVRVVEVWWDEYKDYFYASRPETLTLAYGDISELKRFREKHRCKSFKWFMEEIAYDIPLHYPLPSKNVEWGEIRGYETSYCIDSMGHTDGGTVEIGPCHRMGGNQEIVWTALICSTQCPSQSVTPVKPVRSGR